MKLSDKSFFENTRKNIKLNFVLVLALVLNLEHSNIDSPPPSFHPCSLRINRPAITITLQDCYTVNLACREIPRLAWKLQIRHYNNSGSMWGFVHTSPDTFETAHFFYTNRPFVHMKPVNPHTETEYFLNRSPEWIFFLIRQVWWIRVDDWNRTFFMSTTSYTRVQS